jgi:ATP-dependent DNA helicase RecG
LCKRPAYIVGRQVGVDVVEASVMVVEHADRFGLAQLHQLRGRVGRGSRPSSCYLVTGNDFAMDRLRVMEESQDGFRIAEADLNYR